MGDDVEVRAATAADRPAVLALLAASLGWVPDDEHAAFFEWKHEANPAGPSPAWVAVAGGRVVAFRTFLRWEFERDGEVVRAVRAVDTATHPEWQGRGLFARLTRHALDALAAEGVAFVFNTPNDQSRPGYLKMGWEVVGRLPVRARPRSLAVVPRLARARVPAEKWSQPSEAGVPAAEAFADDGRLAGLLASQPAVDGLRGRRTPAFLRWRYGFGPLHYRAVAGDGGLVVFRLRRRGPLVEAALCDVLVDGGDPRLARPLLAAALRASGADYAVWLGDSRGFIPLPGQGPLLVWRSVADAARPPLARWDLRLGDVELF